MKAFTQWLTALGGATLGWAAWRLFAPELWQRAPSPFLASAPVRATVLITGASSGIGEAFARRLAREGYNLVLVARRKERLEALAEDLKRRHTVSAQAFVADLSRKEDIQRVADLVASLADEGQLDLLINNAGFGFVGSFVEVPLVEQLNMLAVHVEASVQLTRAALPGFLRRRRGGIINVASIAGWFPMPGNATYGASKRYLINFSQSLQAELQGSGVYVQALCPGFTYSEFHDAPSYRAAGFRRDSVPPFLWQTAEQVVEASLNQLGRGEVICIPGLHNRAIVLLGAITPPGIVRAIRRHVGL
ncbi:MAG: SDR family oxidoreductase [Thermoflexales bacterium]|nr:SDR family oxidoreductase [Thermoflexales bacterium]